MKLKNFTLSKKSQTPPYKSMRHDFMFEVSEVAKAEYGEEKSDTDCCWLGVGIDWDGRLSGVMERRMVCFAWWQRKNSTSKLIELNT